MKGMQLADRKRLPATRNSMTRRTVLFDENGKDIDLYIIFSKYEDTGTIAEVRVTVSKQGSTLQGLVDGWATMVSIALQHGVPMSSIVDKFSDVNFPPCGETSDSRIPVCSSLLDYIARMLALEEEY